MVITLGFASGGYLPADHGMLLLAFVLVILVVSFVADEVRLDRRAVAHVGGLAGLALWALASTRWSPAAAWPVLEAERGLVYAAAATALAVVVTRERVTALVAGIVAGTTLVALYGLATRLFPGDVGGPYDPATGYQLDAPIGYWNALGLLLVLGSLLAVGLALHAESRLQVPAGSALVPLAVALYFTFSRGAVAALLVGTIVLLTLDRRALSRLPVLALAPAVAVVLASRASALTRAGEPLEVARSQGLRLALELAALTLLGAALAGRGARYRRRVRVRLPKGRVLVAGVVAGIALVAAVTLAREGGPAPAAERALAAFREEPPPTAGSLDRRLLSASGHGRADYWRVAARMVERAPVLGEGAGSFERHWLEQRSGRNSARDAHNLYLEVLAELGPLGLALLLAALGAPLTGLAKACGRALVPAVAAAYAAFLAHAAVDWDWEVPILVLVALACASVLSAEARTARPVALTDPLRSVGVATAILTIAVALVAHVGNRALAESSAALARGDTEAAARAAARAQTWAPWSHEPWQLLGEAQLAERDDRTARSSLREAIRRAPDEWRLWFDLAIVSQGAEAQRAVTRARELNPLGDEVRDLQGR